MVTRLYIVRHCQSAGNKIHAFQGQTDAEISDIGAQQLELLALRFRNIPLDAVFSSPLKRAYKTAEAINRFHDLPIQTLDDLMEINVGTLEGKPLQSIAADYPALAVHWNDTPWDCVFPEGESMRQVYARAENAAKTILAACPGKTVAVASHGCLIRNLLTSLLKGGIEKQLEISLPGNTSVTELELEDGAVRVVSMYDDTHLPEEMRSRGGQYHIK